MAKTTRSRATAPSTRASTRAKKAAPAKPRATKPRAAKKTASPVSAQTPPPPADTPFPPLVAACLHALEEKKAGDPRVMDVRGRSNITDFHIVATGTSEPHLRALRIEVEKAVHLAGAQVIGRETKTETGWVVVDAFDVIVHLFTAPVRAATALETLWRDNA
jgi:ribosome-associated protein